jgi:hypothetical protein
MRKAIIVLAVTTAIVCGVATSRLRERVAAVAPEIGQQIGEKLDARVEMGGVSVSFLPFAAEILDVRLSSRATSVEPFAVIERVRVEPELLSLFFGELAVRKITAKGARFQMLRDDHDGGRSSFVPDRWFAALAKMPFELAVLDSTVLLENSTQDPPNTYRAENLAGTIRSDGDGRIQFSFTGAPLGPGSNGRLELALAPGAGPAGGDGIDLEIDVHRGSAAMLQSAFNILRSSDLRDPVQLSLRTKGFLGERSTETKPAAPLLGTARGSLGVVVAGREERLDLDLEIGIDDSRYQVRSGAGTWGDFRFSPTGWLQRGEPFKLAAKIGIDPFEVGAVVAGFGAPERWRPRGRAERALIRVEGSAAEALVRYETEFPELSFDGWSPKVPVKAGPVAIRGSIAAVNTDISASYTAENLEVGTARVDSLKFGVAYWRDKLGVTSLDTQLFGGTLISSLAIFPKTSSAVAGGGLLRDADAREVFANVAPHFPLDIGGRADVAMQINTGEDAGWWIARLGVHRGKIAGANWAREALAQSLERAGAPDALDAVIKTHRTLFGGDGTRFERVAVDVDHRGGALSLSRVVIDLDGVEFRGKGHVDRDDVLALDGAFWVDEKVAATISAAAPGLARARDGKGHMVLPCSVRAAAGKSELTLSPELVAVLSGAEGAPLALSPVQVGPADFADLAPLRQQFGR